MDVPKVWNSCFVKCAQVPQSLPIGTGTFHLPLFGCINITRLNEECYLLDFLSTPLSHSQSTLLNETLQENSTVSAFVSPKYYLTHQYNILSNLLHILLGCYFMIPTPLQHEQNFSPSLTTMFQKPPNKRK